MGSQPTQQGAHRTDEGVGQGPTLRNCRDFSQRKRLFVVAGRTTMPAYRGVAQFGRACGWGPQGRWFKSSRPDSSQREWGPARGLGSAFQKSCDCRLLRFARNDVQWSAYVIARSVATKQSLPRIVAELAKRSIGSQANLQDSGGNVPCAMMSYWKDEKGRSGSTAPSSRSLCCRRVYCHFFSRTSICWPPLKVPTPQTRSLSSRCHCPTG